MGDMTISLQFASLYDRQEVLVWSNCLLDLCMDFLGGNMDTSILVFFIIRELFKFVQFCLLVHNMSGRRIDFNGNVCTPSPPCLILSV